jgi:hypothetical protein
MKYGYKDTPMLETNKEQSRDRPYTRILVIGLQDFARLHSILTSIPRPDVLCGSDFDSYKNTATYTAKIKKQELVMIKLSMKVLEIKKEKGTKNRNLSNYWIS